MSSDQNPDSHATRGLSWTKQRLEKKIQEAQESLELIKGIRNVIIRHAGPLFTPDPSIDVVLISDLLIHPTLSPFDSAASVEEIASISGRSDEQAKNELKRNFEARQLAYQKAYFEREIFRIGYPPKPGTTGLTPPFYYGTSINEVMDFIPVEYRTMQIFSKWEEFNKAFPYLIELRVELSLCKKEELGGKKNCRDFLEDFRWWYFHINRVNLGRIDKILANEPPKKLGHKSKPKPTTKIHEKLELYSLTDAGLAFAKKYVYDVCKLELGADPVTSETCKKCRTLFSMRCLSRFPT